MNQNTQLIPLEQVSAQDLFAGDGIEKLTELVKSVSKEAVRMSEGLSVDDKEGREMIASVAYKVARSKTTIDNAGKDLVADMKAKVKAIDNRRKYARDELDKLKASVRAPLDRWEENEEARIQGHKDAIEEMIDAGNNCIEQYMQYSADEMESVKNRIIGVDTLAFEEFSEAATEGKETAIDMIDTAIERRKQYDKEQEELKQLRKDKEEREKKDAAEREAQQRKEREDRIAREAEERVRREAAEKERKAKAQAEREAAEKEARERNTRHKGACNSEAAEALMKHAGIDSELARQVVTAIAKGKIPRVSIEY